MFIKMQNLLRNSFAFLCVLVIRRNETGWVTLKIEGIKWENKKL